MSKDSRIYLAHILERIQRIERYTAGGKEAFFAEPLVQDAVVRNLEVIGEAAKRIPAEFRQTHPSIPWRGLTALRDVLIHQYEGVSLAEVWGVVDREIAPIRDAITAILPPLEDLERDVNDED